ncbi:benzoate/H(+) symporter BenE family transporter [Comamonas guangdongensis]|uniref:benzoate/H(+) symporter BenE family transporter n=1 Tax=Comamonas guangdongensis TaxID=510515 RepID=UPI003F6E2B44
MVAGFLAVLTSCAGPLAIFSQAVHAGHVANAELSSWIWAISMGAGVSGLLLSRWRSTTGASDCCRSGSGP